jgi:DMSO/TMAO reductase YedYZ molybdopterin-dependent catalytic subunit
MSPDLEASPDRQARPLSASTALLEGLLAAGPALLILVAAHTLTGSPGFLEALADGLTFLPIQIVGGAIDTFGPLAKGLAYLGIGLGFLLAGALVGLVLVRGLPSDAGLSSALGVGLALLAVAEVVVLPLFQAGFLGAATGFDPFALHVPLALACLAYGGTLVAMRSWAPGASGWRSGTAGQRSATRGAGTGETLTGQTPAVALARRTFLGRSIGLLGALSLVGSFGAMISQVLAAARPNAGGASATFAPASFGPTPALTPIAQFYVVAKDLIPPSVSVEQWRLTIDGLVDRPTTLSLAQLQALPAQSDYRTLECISTNIVAGDHLISNQRWTGVRISDLLDQAGVQSAARWILWEAADGYTESIPLSVARDADSWIAYGMGDGPIPTEHGAPARVLIAGRFGMKQPKWVTRMQLAAQDAPGYWEQRGWDEQAVVRTMSRIDSPTAGQIVPMGTPFRAYGVAFAGDRGISAVQLSPDEGKSWISAQLEDAGQAPLGPLTWVRWRADVTLGQAGPARLTVRAIDGTGAVQSGQETAALPSGSTGWHAIRVVAAAGA